MKLDLRKKESNLCNHEKNLRHRHHLIKIRLKIKNFRGGKSILKCDLMLMKCSLLKAKSHLYDFERVQCSFISCNVQWICVGWTYGK